jgi:hypothetical protein
VKHRIGKNPAKACSEAAGHTVLFFVDESSNHPPSLDGWRSSRGGVAVAVKYAPFLRRAPEDQAYAHWEGADPTFTAAKRWTCPVRAASLSIPLATIPAPSALASSAHSGFSDRLRHCDSSSLILASCSRILAVSRLSSSSCLHSCAKTCQCNFAPPTTK